MKRNLSNENIKKLSMIETKNGFKVDVGNYIYNPSYDYDYPSLFKKIEETETHKKYVRIKYFKYYDGTGKYFLETFTNEKSDKIWNVSNNIKKTELEESNRFSLKHLIELAELQTIYK